MIRIRWWWPLVGVAAMILLGLAVRRGPISLDDWFEALDHGVVQVLSYLAKPLSLAVIGFAVVGMALYRRWWRLAVVAVVFPPAAYLLVQFIKPLFGRMKEYGLAYPSGHITTTTVVLGLFVLVAGGALWAVLIAVSYVALAMVGVGSTFHYFTDTIGGMLLGTSIVCVAALVARHDLTRVNPGAIYVTRSG
ncbi:MAG: phosphoesterase PA-phosphatase [Mycobacterium sp.]